MIIEICANSLASALAAQKGGAQRIELCNNLMIGGTTPSPGTIKLVRTALDIEVFVLIRPRVGDFCYSDLELQLILEDIQFCKANGMDGVVVGMLQSDATLQVEQLQKVIQAAHPMKITFHRAFDWVPNPFETMETLIELGVHRILTSGQANTAYEGRELLAQLVRRANNRIQIMPGAGINLDNVKEIVKVSGAKELHLSAKSLTNSSMKSQTPKVLFNGGLDLPELDFYTTDVEKVKAIVGLF